MKRKATKIYMRPNPGLPIESYIKANNLLDSFPKSPDDLTKINLELDFHEE